MIFRQHLHKNKSLGILKQRKLFSGLSTVYIIDLESTSANSVLHLSGVGHIAVCIDNMLHYQEVVGRRSRVKERYPNGGEMEK